MENFEGYPIHSPQAHFQEKETNNANDHLLSFALTSLKQVWSPSFLILKPHLKLLASTLSAQAPQFPSLTKPCFAASLREWLWGPVPDYFWVAWRSSSCTSSGPLLIKTAVASAPWKAGLCSHFDCFSYGKPPKALSEKDLHLAPKQNLLGLINENKRAAESVNDSHLHVEFRIRLLDKLPKSSPMDVPELRVQMGKKQSELRLSVNKV